MANLTSNLSENLDSDTLQKLLNMRDRLQFDSPPSTSMNDLSPFADKSAAESAQTLSKIPYTADDVLANIRPSEEGLGGEGLLSKAGSAIADEGGSLLGKLAGPAALAYEALKSGKGPSDDDEAQAMKGGLYSPIPLPNGGLSGQALADYIKSHSGPQATIGNNPNLDSARGMAGGDDTSVKVVAKSSTKGAPAASDSDDNSDDSSDDSTTGRKDYLQSMLDGLYGSNRNQQMKDAISHADQQRNLANSMRIGDEFASALSKGAYKGNTAVPNAIDKDAQSGISNLLTQQKLSDDQINTAVKAQDLDDKAELKDPSSPVSQAYRDLARQLTPQLAGSPDFDNMSADAIKNAQPMVDTAMRMKMMQEQRQAMLDYKTSTQSDKAYSDMRKSMETFRGNQAAQQASRDVLSADKALTMVQNKDPNTLTVQDLRVLMGEISKIATGGVPTEHGTQDLMPNNLQMKYAEIENFLTSNPTNAEAGAYIQRNMKYLQDMRSVAHQTLSDYRSNIAKGFKNRVRPEDYDEAINDYGLGTPSKTAASGNKIKVTNGSETYMVDPADLPHAMSDGFKQVQ